MDDDPLADRIAGLGVVQDQVVVERAKIVVAEGRPGDLGQRVCSSDSSASAGERGDGGLVVRAS